MRKVKIGIIGGGASGLFVSALLNKSDADIYLYEKNNKLGKKILASGNGKCNFSNVGDYTNKYNNCFANEVIDIYSVEDTLKEFENMGLVYKSDEQGRCYPVSECSSSVLDCLKCSISNVHIMLDSVIDNVEVLKDKILVTCNGNNNTFDYLVCCSGNGASNLGSEKAYSYLNNLNIVFKKSKGSLVPLIVKENVKDLAGVRVKCIAKLLDEDDKVIYEENGEVIFKDNGISGISIFNISSIINRNKGKYTVALDISNGMDYLSLINYFKNKKKDNLFKGFLNDKIGEYILKICNISDKDKLNDNNYKVISNAIRNLKFNIEGLYPLKDGQVASGGVSLEEINENLSLKKYPHIYIAGELLDIDGMCGGYNLQFAWSSAGVIAQDIKKKIEEK